MIKNILFTGLRLYKILELSQVISNAAEVNGLDVKTAEFTNEPLMMTEIVHLRIGEGIYSPLIPQNKADILICFEPVLCIRESVNLLSKDASIVMNDNSILPGGEEISEIQKLYKRYAREFIRFDAWVLPDKDVFLYRGHFLLLGKISAQGMLPVSCDDLRKSINLLMPEKADEYLVAFEAGISGSCRAAG